MITIIKNLFFLGLGQTFVREFVQAFGRQDLDAPALSGDDLCLDQLAR